MANRVVYNESGAPMITKGKLLKSAFVSFALSSFLGATLPGALAMGLGGALWEAGSGGIRPGWRRWILGLFG